MPGTAPTAASEAMLMMWPLRRLTIRSAASFVPKMTPKMLMAIMPLGDFVGLVEESSGRSDSRVVDQHVDGSELTLHVVEEGGERLTVGHVQACVEAEIEVGAGLLDRASSTSPMATFAPSGAASSRWRGRCPSLLR